MYYQDKRTKYGRFMFNITMAAARRLMKHMWLYYLLNYTWGIIMTLVGWCALFIFKAINPKLKIESFGPAHYIMFGDNWGGLELGMNFFIADNMGKSWTLHTKKHELGHTFQNAIWGPLSIFLIFIPSFLRYWYQELRRRKHKSNKPYDMIWFEGNASTTGNEYMP